MHTTVIIIIAGIITLLSLLLKFINVALENVAVFFEIKKKKDEVIQKISLLKPENEKSPARKQFHIAISDWFSAIAIVLISFKLIMEYASIEPLTRVTVFEIGLLFSLLLFNLIFLSISTMERRVGYWIDEFMSIIGNIVDVIESKKINDNQKKSHRLAVRTPVQRKKTVSRSKKK
jgi:hypothetical protein